MKIYEFLLLFIPLLVMQVWSSSSLTVQSGSKSRCVGFDLGTSGARVSIIEPSSSSSIKYEEIYSKAITWKDCGSYDDPTSWTSAIETLLKDASKSLEGGLQTIASICVSGTSASCLIVDRNTREVTRSPRMYNYDIVANAQPGTEKFAEQALECINKHVPPKHTARASTGSLAKLLAWCYESPLTDSEVLCHQSDYVSMILMEDSNPVKSDWHNCLKLGYDVRNKCWPDWMEKCLQDAGIPNPLDNEKGAIPIQVVSPGMPLGTISTINGRKIGTKCRYNHRRWYY